MTLKVGETAPAFRAKADDGSTFDLGEATARSNVVLYFYPKDETMGCTAEACSFRDSWSQIREEDATVVGVSQDSVDSHASFKRHHDLPFTLVSDADGRIRKSYGVTGKLMQPRVTFVIDRNGIVRHVYDSRLSPTSHVREALEALRRLRQPPASPS
ncbi:MAG TPA: peroxiredoxin [Conexivisphaerales archaeon]|nr:peroxiredoxin [Conexivisphaerales archaeon]